MLFNFVPVGICVVERVSVGVERKVIEATLVKTGGNVLRSSQLLGISRGALRYKLAKHKIRPQDLIKKKLVAV